MEQEKALKELKKFHLIAQVVGIVSVVQIFVIYHVIISARIGNESSGLLQDDHLLALRIIFIIFSIVFLKVFSSKEMINRFFSKTQSHNRFSQIFTRSVVRLSFATFPCILGFGLSIISGDRGDFYFFSVLSVIGLIMMWPKYSDWVRDLEEQQRLASIDESENE